MTRSPHGRALAATLEPIVGSVYFAKEAHDAFHALGHGPTTGPAMDAWGSAHWGAVLMTDYHAYFCGRGSVLGQPPGEVIAAAFGVFNPAIVVQAADEGWGIADPAAMREARDRGAVAQLRRILGDPPPGLERVNVLLEHAGSRLQLAGRPMYAGVVARGLPDEPMLRMWRLAERLREFRGDAFVHAFVHHGFDGCEIQVLTERLAGFPPKTYSATRGWTDEELEAAADRLSARGLLEDGALTEAGRRAREEVEKTVDGYCRPIEEALGAEGLVELVRLMQPWADTVRTCAGYYPSSPQEQVLHPSVNEWAVANGLHPFGHPVGVEAGPA
jgi:Helix-turn-helix family